MNSALFLLKEIGIVLWEGAIPAAKLALSIVAGMVIGLSVMVSPPVTVRIVK